VSEGVKVKVAVSVGVKVFVGVFVNVGDGLAVNVGDGEGVLVGGSANVVVGVKVRVRVGVKVAVGDSTGSVKVTEGLASGVPVVPVGEGVWLPDCRFALHSNPSPMQ
jgi:hypothetical protein